MTKRTRKAYQFSARSAAAALLMATAIAAWPATGAQAGETEAKALLKAMSDYLAAQTAISFAFDTNFELVTKDHQKILLASSGKVDLNRPDKIQVERTGGFADVLLNSDGKTLTILGKDANLYAQTEAPGTIVQLIDDLRDKLQRPLPAADLLLPNVYDTLMTDVTDVKDLGSGVIGGKECDHLAFRNDDVDWQIWIAQGDRPYPCQYVITTKGVDQAPQYRVEIRDWKTGSEVAAVDYTFKNSTGATKIDTGKLADMNIDDMPKELVAGAQ